MTRERQDPAEREPRPPAAPPRPAPPLPIASNAALARAVADGDPRLSSLLGRRALQRGPASAAPAADTTYQVGLNTYREDQWGVAIGEVADLWTMVGGIVSKRREAVAEFTGPGGAGAKNDPGIVDAAIEMAITAVIGYATGGVGTVLGAALGKGVTGLAKRLPVDPDVVIARGTKIVDAAVAKGQEKAKEKLGAAMKATPKAKPAGGTDLALPLLKYGSALNTTLDADALGARAATVQQLLAEPADPPGVRWALAAALYDALATTLEQCKREQWSATSDGWFGMQIQSGAGQLRGYDTGIVVIDLADVYPTDKLTADGAYLGGEGANETTMPMYNDRPLGEIDLPIRLRMANGSMGHGILDCGWQAFKPMGQGGLSDVRHITRWGPPWLAAKALNLRDIDTDDERVNGENIALGAQKVWSELSGKSAQSLGASFKAMGMSSGVGASPF